jgi:hypothetical protein
MKYIFRKGWHQTHKRRLTDEANKFNASIWEERKPPLAATMQGFSEEEIQVIERFLKALAYNYQESIKESD